MRRLQLLILLFSLGLTLPLGLLAARTWSGLAQEEQAELAFFAETLFDRMETELADLVQTEEARDIDEYSHKTSQGLSPLARPESYPDYVVGYLQNNPDGSFQTPLIRSDQDMIALAERLEGINQIVNGNRAQPAPVERPKTAPPVVAPPRKQQPLESRYLTSRPLSPKEEFEARARKVREVPTSQAYNLAPEMEDKLERELNKMAQAEEVAEPPKPSAQIETMLDAAPRPQAPRLQAPEFRSPPPPLLLPENALPEDSATTARSDTEASQGQSATPDKSLPQQNALSQNGVRVELDPMQALDVGEGQFFLFRRVVLNGRIYRQGLVLDLHKLLNHLQTRHFVEQPLARFTMLRLEALEGERILALSEQGDTQLALHGSDPDLTRTRRLLRPFSFIQAELLCGGVPPSPGRASLRYTLLALGGVLLVGLFAIHQSARVIVDHSERRANFVSSVTHELKTPLTNIRMYVEMLEQGMAPTPERKRQYLAVVGSESARLSRLIDNVLEFSRLERKKRSLNMREGNLSDVLEEVDRVMAEKLHQEGFELVVEKEDIPLFRYDCEVLVGLVLNLLENSVKFGANAPLKRITLRAKAEGGRVELSVSDTGPGIAARDLKRIFDDFSRGEDEMTRTTKGTGIGLALVRKFTEAMGGTVRARNNQGPGCTVSMRFPLMG
ncbi:MAG: HAMP domain-containing sensor histidine kinase [Desulfovibrionaceae bacterium]